MATFPVRVWRALRCVGLKLHSEFSVKLIAAALGDDVDYAARCAAKLGIETARLHLHFLYELERQVVGVAQVGRCGSL